MENPEHIHHVGFRPKADARLGASKVFRGSVVIKTALCHGPRGPSRQEKTARPVGQPEAAL